MVSTLGVSVPGYQSVQLTVFSGAYNIIITVLHVYTCDLYSAMWTFWTDWYPPKLRSYRKTSSLACHETVRWKVREVDRAVEWHAHLLEPESDRLRNLESLIFGEKHAKNRVRFAYKSLTVMNVHPKILPVLGIGHFENSSWRGT